MADYIIQDGCEKAEEIDVITEEEYNIEKRNYIARRVGTVKKYYDNLETKYQQQVVVNVSKMKSQAYRDILNARNNILLDVLNMTGDRITHVTNSKNTCIHKQVLYQLTIQALIKMMEHNVIVKVREQDVELMKLVSIQAARYFKEKTNMDVNITVSHTEFLPARSKGGFKMQSPNLHITLDNTLESRLSMMSERVLPRIRMLLFGPNLNRKHMD